MLKLADQVKRIFNGLSQIETKCWEELLQIIEYHQYSKHHWICRHGDSYPKEAVVISGLLRTFRLGKDGQEYTLDFYREGQLLSPYFSRTYEQKSLVNIECLEDCLVASFDHEAFTRLRYRYNSLLQLGNRVTEGELMKKTDKEISMATHTANERYKLFQQKYPGLENRISQGIVASYLGVNPVSLSRLRGHKPTK